MYIYVCVNVSEDRCALLGALACDHDNSAYMGQYTATHCSTLQHTVAVSVSMSACDHDNSAYMGQLNGCVCVYVCVCLFVRTVAR